MCDNTRDQPALGGCPRVVGSVIVGPSRLQARRLRGDEVLKDVGERHVVHQREAVKLLEAVQGLPSSMGTLEDGSQLRQMRRAPSPRDLLRRWERSRVVQHVEEDRDAARLHHQVEVRAHRAVGVRLEAKGRVQSDVDVHVPIGVIGPLPEAGGHQPCPAGRRTGLRAEHTIEPLVLVEDLAAARRALSPLATALGGLVSAECRDVKRGGGRAAADRPSRQELHVEAPPARVVRPARLHHRERPGRGLC
mmetsp:Transcript_30451/g.68714  ORF Transcript_30451/g.68714 Transcript_30451/m.68714 type:complete len:249 (-) Transcript_30451:261-1007(-)